MAPVSLIFSGAELGRPTLPSGKHPPALPCQTPTNAHSHRHPSNVLRLRDLSKPLSKRIPFAQGCRIVVEEEHPTTSTPFVPFRAVEDQLPELVVDRLSEVVNK